MATAPTAAKTDKQEIVIISHSSLFYWWPVWAIGFIFALITLFDNQRLGVFPSHTTLQAVVPVEDGKMKEYTFKTPPGGTEILNRAEANKSDPFPIRVSSKSWMGAIFCAVLLLVIVVTNVPLRGLWSVIIIVVLIMVVLVLALFNILDEVFAKLGNLHIYINMGGYLFISGVLFAMWMFTMLIFDRQVYMKFTPGQVRVCTEIGGGETAHDTIGMTIQKQRDDLFRHWVLGIGSGDLIVKTSGANAQEFHLPNVLFIGSKLAQIMEMQRDRPVVQGG